MTRRSSVTIRKVNYQRQKRRLAGLARAGLSFEEAKQKIIEAGEGWGTDEARIYQALQKLTEAEVAQISKVPGLWGAICLPARKGCFTNACRRFADP